MARKLKAYQTSLGFYDLAIAAPSMKAAAEAWGSQIDVFRRGFAKETHEAAIVTATMARPGVVLKRPVGSAAPFTEHAELPRLPNLDNVKESPAPRSKSKQPPARKTDDRAAAPSIREGAEKTRGRASEGRGESGEEAEATGAGNCNGQKGV